MGEQPPMLRYKIERRHRDMVASTSAYRVLFYFSSRPSNIT